MTLPQKYSLTIVQGSSLKRWFALKYPNGAIVNLATAGYTIGRLQVRTAYPDDGGTLVLDLTNANGGVVIDYQADADGRYWSGYLFASATTTSALDPFGEGVFDFEISNGTDVIRVMEGPATLAPNVTI